MLTVKDFTGLWTRSIQVWADGRRDVTTEVGWLQGPALFADLRQPPELKAAFAHVRGINSLTMDDCARLAVQQGFAGIFNAKADYFEWSRQIDYQPVQGKLDAGRLFWQGDILVEEGLQKEHFEHWHRDPALPVEPAAAFALKDKADGRWGNFLRVGDMFMYARDRRDLLANCTLREAVNGAADISSARAMVDFEISFGLISAKGWRITRSTLPFREGRNLTWEKHGSAGLKIGEIDDDGDAVTRDWEIAGSEGDDGTFFENNAGHGE